MSNTRIKFIPDSKTLEEYIRRVHYCYDIVNTIASEYGWYKLSLQNVMKNEYPADELEYPLLIIDLGEEEETHPGHYDDGYGRQAEKKVILFQRDDAKELKKFLESVD